MQFTKDVLPIGVHLSGDGGLLFEQSPLTIERQIRQFSEYRRAGFSSDIFVDHGDARRSLRPSRKPPHPDAVGELLRMALSPDGRSIRLTVDLHHADAIEHAQANDRQLSYVILPQVNASGGRCWRNMVAAFDLVPESADARQGPFIPLADDSKFACVLAFLPPSLADEVRELAESIDPADLAADGMEDEPHVTVLFGLHGDDPGAVARLLRDEPPLSIKLGKTGRFAGEEHDVLFVEGEGESIHRLHDRIRRTLPNTQTHATYRPHVTLAYLRPGAAQKYIGIDRMNGRSIRFESLVFSDRNHRHSRLILRGLSMPTQEEKFRKTLADARKLGVPLPAGTTRETFWREMRKASAAMAAQAKRRRFRRKDDDDDALDDSPETTGPSNRGIEIQEPGFAVALGLEQRREREQEAARRFVDDQATRLKVLRPVAKRA